jgi:hypothetical protein
VKNVLRRRRNDLEAQTTPHRAAGRRRGARLGRGERTQLTDLRAWRRTVVVYVTERASLPAQSASQRVFFVGRFEADYKVWRVVR